MKVKAILKLCMIFLICMVEGMDTINLSEDEQTSLVRFELLHKIACEKNDSNIFMTLLAKKGRENLKTLDGNKLQDVINNYPEVVGILLVVELSREEFIESVGTRMSDQLIDKNEVGVRFFKAEFKLANNGTAPSYVIFKNGVFYKAVL